MSLASRIRAFKYKYTLNKAFMEFAMEQWKAGEDQDVLPMDGVEYMKLDQIGPYSYWIEFTKKENWNFNNYVIMKEDGDELLTVTDEDEINRTLAAIYTKIMDHYNKTK